MDFYTVLLRVILDRNLAKVFTGKPVSDKFIACVRLGILQSASVIVRMIVGRGLMTSFTRYFSGFSVNVGHASAAERMDRFKRERAALTVNKDLHERCEHMLKFMETKNAPLIESSVKAVKIRQYIDGLTKNEDLIMHNDHHNMDGVEKDLVALRLQVLSMEICVYSQNNIRKTQEEKNG